MVVAGDFLGLHLKGVPFFRALVREVEAQWYQGLELPPPTLDLGCSDGYVAAQAFSCPLDVGVERRWPAVKGPAVAPPRPTAYWFAPTAAAGWLADCGCTTSRLATARVFTASAWLAGADNRKPIRLPANLGLCPA